MSSFSHLHVHTQFSLLDGAASISALYKKAVNDNMRAIAITDHGNMFGAFKFVAEAGKHNTPENPNKIKAIVGCEFYVVNDRHKKQFTKDDKDVRYHQLLLAKNAEGYRNLTKLCSLGYMEGLYGKYPRIDKELILKYHKGLIATTCCIGASVPKTILKNGIDAGETEFKWWLDIFGDDYYVEIQRHEIPEQTTVNEALLKFAQKHKVKIIASNDSHYVDREDFNAHDILLCINTGEKQSTPTMKEFSDDEAFPKDKRFAFYNDQFYFKTTAEMSQLFSDLPEAIDNTNEIADKIEPLKLKQDILLPHFKIPEGFVSQDEYLKHITFEGAKKRYIELTPEVEERINFELFTIKTMGFAGYFLIVADFIKAGRDLGVLIGPGRGSAAGSAVAYCIEITNIDPIKYNLLFERFLNPDRKSMPDIDTDFDDEGRQKVIDYVVEKYGKNQVAQIVTYGTMAAKMSIKDVSRVMDLPLQDANNLVKLVPDRPGIELNWVIKGPIKASDKKNEKDKTLTEELSPEDLENAKKLRKILDDDNSLQSKVLKEALILEGSVRGTGIHAAGIIIAPKDLSEIIPVAKSKETELLITQYDGKVIEDAGVIKMDFLGLKTLTILRDTLILIKENHGVTIDLDTIPLDDKKTLELYQRGETNATFQFESAGMQKHLKDLKPDKFEDLIAMNALYRPGPMEYIPNFIARKNGKEAVSYDLPEMEDHLKETYGITVYQEQVMLLSQKLGGFTKGDADVLRKAMGKKDKAILDKMRSKFVEGCAVNNLNTKICEKIWVDWEAFAQYAFNKSHATCYAVVSFQTAYLKTHYPGEYMSAVLTHNLSNIDKITFFMEESKRMGIPVLGPDVNESNYRFAVNKKGEIRFGLGAVKGVGEGAVEALVEERKNGFYKDIFDLVRRINLRSANKKTFESLAYGGGFDSFQNIYRSQYFAVEKDNTTFLEKVIRYGVAFQDSQNSNQNSLFGDAVETQIPEPAIPVCEPWGNIQSLKAEKEVIGFYISGHPLDDYKLEMSFCTHKMADLSDLQKLKNGKEICIAGIIGNAQHKTGKTGNLFGTFTLEDYDSTHDFAVFSKEYLNIRSFLVNEAFVFVKGRVEPRWNNSDQLEFKISSIQLLNEVKDKMLKSITLQLPLTSLSDEFITQINTLFHSEKKGKCHVKFVVFDKTENISIEMPSKKIKIDITNDLIKKLDDISELKYRLN